MAKWKNRFSESEGKKRYGVNVHFDVVVPIEVYASSEQEAEQLAISRAHTIDIFDSPDMDIYTTDACVTEEYTD